MRTVEAAVRCAILGTSFVACLAGCSADDGLLASAPTKLEEVEVTGGNVRVVGLGGEFAVASQDQMTGGGILARYSESLAPMWSVTFDPCQPLALRSLGDDVISLACENVYVFDEAGNITANWTVPGAHDLAVGGGRLVVLTDDAVEEFDVGGTPVATHPIDPEMTTSWALEASAAGYCTTGFFDAQNRTTCFSWDGVRAPRALSGPDSAALVERDFAVLGDAGIVSTLSVSDALHATSMDLDTGYFAGEYEFPYTNDSYVAKLFLGQDDRVMWLEVGDWCTDNCFKGFRVGLLDADRSSATWRSELFEVPGVIGNMWTATVDGDRIYVASNRAVWVVTAE
jgi:hypothetical protein